MTKLDLEDLERKATAATPGAWTTTPPPRDANGWAIGMMVAQADAEHIAANSPPVTLALIGRIRRLEVELARAAGIARARGAHDYADDFMRVAQDREDFDAEILEKGASQ